MAIGELNAHIREELRKLSESDSLISQMVPYRDASKPKQLGILKFRSMAPGTKMGYEEWEQRAIINYHERNGL